MSIGRNALPTPDRPPIRVWLQQRFGRVSRSGEVLPQIEGLRCLAILAVAFFHAEIFFSSKGGLTPAEAASRTPLSWIFQQGHVGVQLFFVISGFVLALPYCRAYLPEIVSKASRPSMRSYFVRRLSRLEPPYLVSLVLCYIGLIVRGRFDAGELLPNLLASSVYMHNLLFGGMSRVNGVAWSLEIELQFYVLLPFLATVLMLPRWRRRSGLGAMIAASLVVNLFVAPGTPANRSVIAFFHYFVTGVLLSDVVLSRQFPVQRSVWWDLAGCGALAATWTLSAHFEDPWIDALLLVAVSLLVYSAFSGRFLRSVFSWWPACLVGGMCYSIYLVHYPLISMIGGMLIPWRTETWSLDVVVFPILTVPLVCMASSGFYLLVERPTMASDWPTRAGGWLQKRVLAPMLTNYRWTTSTAPQARTMVGGTNTGEHA